MSRLLFDTTFLIDWERSGADLDRMVEDDDDVAVAAVTIAELRVGVLLASDRQRPARAAYVDDLVAGIPVLNYDLEVADAHATLLVEARSRGKPRGAHDLIIAATAKAFRRTVVSADAGAFVDLPGVAVRSHR
jgi:tRNA(fMet)-specific endonuclease VapC